MSNVGFRMSKVSEEGETDRADCGVATAGPRVPHKNGGDGSSYFCFSPSFSTIRR